MSQTKNKKCANPIKPIFTTPTPPLHTPQIDSSTSTMWNYSEDGGDGSSFKPHAGRTNLIIGQSHDTFCFRDRMSSSHLLTATQNEDTLRCLDQLWLAGESVCLLGCPPIENICSGVNADGWHCQKKDKNRPVIKLCRLSFFFCLTHFWRRGGGDGRKRVNAGRLRSYAGVS